MTATLIVVNLVNAIHFYNLYLLSPYFLNFWELKVIFNNKISSHLLKKNPFFSIDICTFKLILHNFLSWLTTKFYYKHIKVVTAYVALIVTLIVTLQQFKKTEWVKQNNLFWTRNATNIWLKISDNTKVNKSNWFISY